MSVQAGLTKKRASEIHEQTPWQELTEGAAIFEPVTASCVNTGEWRTHVPVLDERKCIHCLLCFLYCPDCAVPVKDGKRQPFDLMHCKGCGICAKVCPCAAIRMEEESK